MRDDVTATYRLETRPPSAFVVIALVPVQPGSQRRRIQPRFHIGARAIARLDFIQNVTARFTQPFGNFRPLQRSQKDGH